ncbi:lysophospholipid acyltransferase family protein [Candidatus Dependentiae bacterium]|nr:lysophospholipid acyltransferase family protein [Candidatus Dependentiae bacterium]
MLKKIKHLSEYYIILFFYKTLKKIPVFFLYIFADILGKIMYYFVPVRKKIITENIRRIFGDIHKNEVDNIIKKSYINICKTAFEYFIIPDLNNNNYEHFGFIENKHIIENALKEGNGAVLLGAHFDNPELVTNLLKLSGLKMCALVKKQQNRYITNLFEEIRTSNGVELFYKDSFLKSLYKRLKQNYAVATVADISVDSRDGIIVNFCGYPLPTPSGPAMFALKTNAAVIPVFSARMNDNRHRIIVYERIDQNINQNLDQNEKVKIIMSRYNDLLEQNIRKYPDQWFWMHNRWKSYIKERLYEKDKIKIEQ